MKLLLDTHIILWWPVIHELSEETQMVLNHDPDPQVSAASTWEVAIKQATGRSPGPADLRERIRDSGFSELPINVKHTLIAARLPLIHRDPFDRMLIAQTKAEGLVLASHDANIHRYDVDACLALANAAMCSTLADLRREFENPCPALKTVASRRSRGVYKRDRRPLEPTVVDSRGRTVRAVGMTQTFLRPAQVDELVALYREGATLVELGERFSVHRRTVAAHLVRRSVPIRRRGLDDAQLTEAVRLYTGG